MSAILDLAFSLSLLATKPMATEAELLQALTSSRSHITIADHISFWRLQAPGLQKQPMPTNSDVNTVQMQQKLECVASDADGMRGRTLSLSDTLAFPCIALLEATGRAEPLPMHPDLTKDDLPGASELHGRFPGARDALYVPVAGYIFSSDTIVQFGVIELVLCQRAEELSESNQQHNTDMHVEQSAACSSSSSDGVGGGYGGAHTFTPLMSQQIIQLSAYLATALQSLQLSDAEQQGERLLYRMLPKHIVSQLRQRSTPEDFIVESSECAYVLYSDIVGFTAYCANRDPRDVVVMLNSMFATFDGLLAKHGVHKVTTIGDAYVAATGLPFQESATPHLDIIAFALDLKDAVRSFVAADGERMQVRIGIHAGPVAAGVVGVAMPR